MTQDEERSFSLWRGGRPAAAAELQSRYGRRQSGVRTKSGPTDLVSDADIAAEYAIRVGACANGAPTTRSSARRGERRETASLRWVVDPLDGTINYLYEIPAFAVSVALRGCRRDGRGRRPRSGARRGVRRDALGGGHAQRRADRRARPPARAPRRWRWSRPDLAMTREWRARQAEVVARVLPRRPRHPPGRVPRRWTSPGARCGRVDAFYERGLKSWDSLRACWSRRAGLAVREIPGVRRPPWGVMTAPARIVDELYELIVAEEASRDCSGPSAVAER